ncbi:MAG: hypothetical protein RBU27_12245 [Bacteroidota bacterium]|jgi:hypothetical protein|nr:hypothetical protein [Bacteroidota bacterium]
MFGIAASGSRADICRALAEGQCVQLRGDAPSEAGIVEIRPNAPNFVRKRADGGQLEYGAAFGVGLHKIKRANES